MTTLLALLALIGSPADTLRGRVSDSTGAPLAGVAVSITELDRRTLTDAGGAFAFAQVPAGRYTVVARMPGFAPRTAIVTAPAAPLALTLRPAAFELPAVVVTATRQPADPLSSPLSTSTLGADRPAKQDISLAHALAGVPGVRTVSTGGEMGKPMIRGLTGSRVLTLDAGNRLEDYSWSDEDGPSVDAAFADRVEVIRGPASVLYGSDALGGVVNAVPAPVPEADSGRGFVRGGSDLYFASNNAEMGALLRMEGAGGGTGWRASLAGRRSEALHTPAGEIENTGFLALDGDAALGVRGNWGRGTLRFVHYGGEFHLHEANDTGPPPPPGSPEEGPVRKLLDDRLQASAELPLGGMQLEVKSQAQRHWLAEVVEGDTASTEQGFDLLLTTGTLDVLAHHALGANIHGTFGVSGFAQGNATRGDEPLVPGAAARGVGTFVFEQADIGRWSVSGGARVDLRRLDADSNTDLALSAQSRNYHAWSGDVGLAFRPVADVAITANLGRAWRAPTLFELFANGPHVGEGRFELGDTTLVPEAGITGDLSLRWRGARLQGELSAYASSYTHYIYVTPTGGTQDSLPVYAYQQGDATLAGAEGRIEVLVVPDVSVRARADFVNGTLKNGGPLPLVPPLAGDVGIDWRLSELTWATRASVSVDAELAARQRRIATYDVPTAGYGLLHVGAQLEKPVGGRALRLELAVRNALNTSYKNFLSRYKRFALDPGRSIVVRLGTDF